MISYPLQIPVQQQQLLPCISARQNSIPIMQLLRAQRVIFLLVQMIWQEGRTCASPNTMVPVQAPEIIQDGQALVLLPFLSVPAAVMLCGTVQGIGGKSLSLLLVSVASM